MSDPIDFACRLKDSVDGRSVRSLAEQSGWGRSTVHEWLSGSRLPNPQQLDDLMDAVGAPEEVRSALAAQLASERETAASGRSDDDSEDDRGYDPELESGDSNREAVIGRPEDPLTGRPIVGMQTRLERPSTAEPAAGEAAGNQPRGGQSPSAAGRVRERALRRPAVGALIAILAIVAAAAFGGGYTVGRFGRTDTSSARQSDGTDGKQGADGAAGSPRAVAGVPVRVAHTQDKGLFTFVGPSSDTEHVSSLTEGQQVTVVCLALHGELKSDKSLQQSRTVWALLSTGSWVPDLYLNTKKDWKPPQDPPKPFKVC